MRNARKTVRSSSSSKPLTAIGARGGQIRPQTAQPNIEKLKERQALHELLRIGMGRAEDLRFLQKVEGKQTEVAPQSAPQLLEECELREEFRVARELELQKEIVKFNFVSCTDEESQQLADQLLALNQVLEEDRMRQRPPLPNLAAYRTNILGGSRKSSPRKSKPSTPKANAAPSSNPYSTNPALPLPLGYKKPASKAKGVEDAAAGRALKKESGWTPTPTGPPAPATRAPRPASAPQARDADGAKRRPRHQQLIVMQRTLRTGILVHVEDDGENAASRALQKNIGEAQEHFKMCLQDTRASMGLLGGAVGSGGRRRMAWDKHVNPGILGVTPGQEALAERLRRKRALRLIQRTWRAYYKRTAPVRKAKLHISASTPSQYGSFPAAKHPLAVFAASCAFVDIVVHRSGSPRSGVLPASPPRQHEKRETLLPNEPATEAVSTCRSAARALQKQCLRVARQREPSRSSVHVALGSESPPEAVSRASAAPGHGCFPRARGVLHQIRGLRLNTKLRHAAAAKKAKVQAKREEEATVVIQKTWRGGGGRVEVQSTSPVPS
ncbi:hypothetical protein CYMTET_52454 [Cymbomonas tetramitiformis]|uniref:Uncharacterized protein n=1 Tax=Cymbomonas tetramitiformis TaxID=36881 RepID=A0AAE0ERB4_9CHLO|nr:hypothetical protein CYMTET_52454 [Cymbomonas tetramitiformis]